MSSLSEYDFKILFENLQNVKKPFQIVLGSMLYFGNNEVQNHK